MARVFIGGSHQTCGAGGGEYAGDIGAEYLGLAQSFHLAVENRPLESGDEVFSLIRESELPPDDYISRFLDTGTEFQGHME